MTGLKLRDLRIDEHGHYRALIVNGDLEVPVNRQFGSWQTDAGREVLPAVAGWLQHLVRQMEKRERAALKVKEEVGS